MKFAVAALLGVVSAQQDLSELMGVRYKKHYIDEATAQIMDIGQFLEKNEKKMEEGIDKMFDSELIEDFAESDRADQYMKQLEAWGRSPSVRAEQAYEKNVVAKTPEGKALIGAGMKVYGDFANATKGNVVKKDNDFNYFWAKNGDYIEAVNNKFVARVLEDLYDVKEKLKALTETKTAAAHMQMQMATLEDPHFKKLHKMFMHDMHVKTCDELIAKLMTKL